MGRLIGKKSHIPNIPNYDPDTNVMATLVFGVNQIMFIDSIADQFMESKQILQCNKKITGDMGFVSYTFVFAKPIDLYYFGFEQGRGPSMMKKNFYVPRS